MIDKETLREAVDELIGRDHHLHQVIVKHGYPPLWSRKPGFPTLVKIILEQQVSLASAQAAYDKLLERVNQLTPENFIALNELELKQIGFSRQKIKYCRILSESILLGDLDLGELTEYSDKKLMTALTDLKGVGPWTAGIYLLMALRRPDVWPIGDRALLVSMRDVKHLSRIPSNETAVEIAEAWRPWRSVAARILWHKYLSER
jgi:DNA-3-methyladenine glycosylase II